MRECDKDCPRIVSVESVVWERAGVVLTCGCLGARGPFENYGRKVRAKVSRVKARAVSGCQLFPRSVLGKHAGRWLVTWLMYMVANHFVTFS